MVCRDKSTGKGTIVLTCDDCGLPYHDNEKSLDYEKIHICANCSYKRMAKKLQKLEVKDYV
jgi:DNA-directed RNA polymerase subunit RPC12/RpoP